MAEGAGIEFLQRVLRKSSWRAHNDIVITLSLPEAGTMPPGRAWTTHELPRRAIAPQPMDIVVKPGVTWTHNSNEAGRPVVNGKESPMCLEFSEWSWKLRA